MDGTELAEAGVLARSADGSFDPADINRVRIAESLVDEGFALEDVTRLLSINRLSFAPIDGLLASLMALDRHSLDERSGCSTDSALRESIPISSSRRRATSARPRDASQRGRFSSSGLK